MPRNAKEGFLFGISFCTIMAFSMGLINISIGMGGLSKASFITSVKAFPITFLIAFAVENLIVGPTNKKLLKKFVAETDSVNAKILFNCVFIVTMMSIIMTYAGSMLGGESIKGISSKFFTVWPRNFWAAFFVNIVLAGPISRAVLRFIQRNKMAVGDELSEA